MAFFLNRLYYKLDFDHPALASTTPVHTTAFLNRPTVTACQHCGLSTDMGPKTKRAASSDMDDQAAMALCLIELLNDDQVLDKLRRVLYLRELSAKIDSANDHIGLLKAMLTEKEERVKLIEVKVAKLEENADSVDQYGRRAHLHIRGVPESMAIGEDTDELVLRVLNEKIDMTPKAELHQLVRTHRLGRANDDRQRQPCVLPPSVFATSSSKCGCHSRHKTSDRATHRSFSTTISLRTGASWHMRPAY